jgi:hypothetical protein
MEVKHHAGVNANAIEPLAVRFRGASNPVKRHANSLV